MYAKHCNLVDADAPGAKSSTKHLESCLEVIQGHFGITKKLTRDCVLFLSGNVGFRVGLESLTVWVCLHSNFSGGLRKTIFFLQECV